jgi:hypothetical protein
LFDSPFKTIGSAGIFTVGIKKNLAKFSVKISGGSLGSRAARKALKRAKREAQRKLVTSSPAARRHLPSRSPSQNRGNRPYFCFNICGSRIGIIFEIRSYLPTSHSKRTSFPHYRKL